MAETILSYLLAEESSNPQRISKKVGGLGSGEDGISLISLGWMENGKITRQNVLDDASGKKTRLRPTGITISFI
jgi:hypothetical protein